MKLASLPNFRDLAGIEAQGGRTVRPGLIYRSEGPRHLQANDAEILRQTGFALVCDLRSAGERQVDANDWCDGTAIELVHADVLTDIHAADRDGQSALRQGRADDAARRIMLDNYRQKPLVMIPHFQLLFRRILERTGLPMLIHCTAGKDRTGFAVAIVLLALGASDDAVMTDYRRTDDLIGDRFDQTVRAAYLRTFHQEPDAQSLAALRRADPDYLTAALDEIVARWGGIEPYLAEAIGLGREDSRKLQDLLLE